MRATEQKQQHVGRCAKWREEQSSADAGDASLERLPFDGEETVRELLLARFVAFQDSQFIFRTPQRVVFWLARERDSRCTSSRMFSD